MTRRNESNNILISFFFLPTIRHSFVDVFFDTYNTRRRGRRTYLSLSDTICRRAKPVFRSLQPSSPPPPHTLTTAKRRYRVYTGREPSEAQRALVSSGGGTRNGGGSGSLVILSVRWSFADTPPPPYPHRRLRVADPIGLCLLLRRSGAPDSHTVFLFLFYFISPQVHHQAVR